MKILVTGANGYLGRGIVCELLNNGHQVIATDFSTDGVDERATAMECNLFEVNEPMSTFGNPDVLLHLAWRDGFVHNSPAHIEDLPKHYDFIKKMIIGGVNKVVVMGSMHEVGFYEGSINVQTPCNPMSLYGITKNALRDATELLTKQHNVLFQWLRAFYIVGNTSYGSSIFSKIVAAEDEKKETFPFTMGQNQYDYLDYEDFCRYVAAAVGQNSVLGIINICSGKPEKLADRVERFIKENNFRIKLKYGAFPDRLYDSKAVWGDSRDIEMIMNNQEYLINN